MQKNKTDDLTGPLPFDKMKHKLTCLIIIFIGPRWLPSMPKTENWFLFQTE